MKKRLNWYRGAFCKLHFDMHTPAEVTDIASGFDPGEFVRRLQMASPDAICFFAKSAIGWSHYPTRIGAMHPHLKRDLLGEAVEACHKAGIKLIAYYCIEILPPPIAQAHPEYLMRTKDGEPVRHQNRFVSCINSPVQEGLILPQLREILEGYDVDGIFFDGFPALHQICFCEGCRRSFGGEIPDGPDHPEWRGFLSWQQRRLDEWCTETARFIHSIRPDVMVGVNWLAANRYADEPPPEIDYLTADYPVTDNCSLGTSYQLAAWCWREIPCDVMNARMLHWWSDWTSRPAAALKSEFASSIAYCSPLFLGDLLPPDTSLPDLHVMELAGEAFRFARERESLIHEARPIADVALINSFTDHLFTSGSPSRDESALRGAFLAAVESGHTVHILLESDLKEHLRGYKMALICETGFLGEDVCEIIRRFVADGGRLVVCGKVPLGTDGDSLEDVLGVRVEGESDDDRAYLRVPDEYADQLWPDWEPVRPWVLVHGRYQLTSAERAKVLTQIVAPGARYQLGAQAPSHSTEFAAITLNDFGKGKAAFCVLPLAGDYWRRGNSGAKYILSGMIDLVLPDRTVEVKGDLSLQVALALKENAMIVHLLSYHAERRPGNPPVVERIPPVKEIELRIRVGRSPTSLIQLPEGRRLDWEFEEGLLQTIIPDMHIHTAVLISF